MAIEGPLRELGIHDVFQLLDLSRKTGRLRVSSALRDNEGVVFFRKGRVVSASIRSNPHPLGALLLRAGRITEQDLGRARAMQESAEEKRRLGEILVDLGALTGRDLQRFMRQQVEAVIFELLSWQEGFFSFVEGDVAEREGPTAVSVPTESLLMEGARRLDEWTQIQQRIPHLGVVPRLADVPADAPASQLDLLPNEWEVLAMIDGERDLRIIAGDLGRSEFDVARIAFGLLTTAVITVEAPGEPVAAEAATSRLAGCLAEAREALQHDQLDGALTLAAAAVSIAPADAEARVTLARALQRSGREVEAEEELRQALTFDARHPGALMDAARLAARRGELERAIGLWQKVAAVCPGTPIAEQARHAIAHASRLSAALEAVDA
jgi:hypothetical protein